MPSSKVLKEDQAALQVFDYNPQKFPVEVPEQANSFVRTSVDEVPKGGFRLNELISQQIGVSESEKKLLEERVEELAVQRLKDIQENAYKEAYDLGIEEGRENAFNSLKAELEEKMTQLDTLLASISTLKKDLVTFNETHIVQLLAHLAGKIAMREAEVQKDAIMPVLIQATEGAQATENVTVRISKPDMEFISSLREDLKKQINGFENLKFEVDEQISSGGCIVETNYGVVDATIEQRVEKVWAIFSEKSPIVKDKISEGT